MNCTASETLGRDRHRQRARRPRAPSRRLRCARTLHALRPARSRPGRSARAPSCITPLASNFTQLALLRQCAGDHHDDEVSRCATRGREAPDDCGVHRRRHHIRTPERDHRQRQQHLDQRGRSSSSARRTAGSSAAPGSRVATAVARSSRTSQRTIDEREIAVGEIREERVAGEIAVADDRRRAAAARRPRRPGKLALDRHGEQARPRPPRIACATRPLAALDLAHAGRPAPGGYSCRGCWRTAARVMMPAAAATAARAAARRGRRSSTGCA